MGGGSVRVSHFTKKKKKKKMMANEEMEVVKRCSEVMGIMVDMM